MASTRDLQSFDEGRDARCVQVGDIRQIDDDGFPIDCFCSMARSRSRRAGEESMPRCPRKRTSVPSFLVSAVISRPVALTTPIVNSPLPIVGRPLSRPSESALRHERGHLVPVVSEGIMDVRPELSDNRVCGIQDDVCQPALTGLRPRAILARVVCRGDSCGSTCPNDLGRVKNLSPAVTSGDERPAHGVGGAFDDSAMS